MASSRHELLRYIMFGTDAIHAVQIPVLAELKTFIFVLAASLEIKDMLVRAQASGVCVAPHPAIRTKASASAEGLSFSHVRS
jgi:hypothetical protein